MIDQNDSREAEHLVAQRIHPQTIAQGWRLARSYARKALEDASIDNSADPAIFREDLFRIARTTLSSKVVTHDKDYFAELAVEAVLRLKVSTRPVNYMKFVRVYLYFSSNSGLACQYMTIPLGIE